jgi:hypothetical protein
MWRVVLVLSLLNLGCFEIWADSNSAAIDKLHGIPPAVPNYFPQDDNNPKIPLLILTADGAFVNKAKTPIPFDKVLKALSDLPKDAWPYGRVILYYNSPPGLSDGRLPRASDVKQVEADLKAADIKLIFGASA